MKRGHIIIPKSDLGHNLDRASVIKAEMMELLRELEETAAGKKIEKVGTWRHDPKGWINRNKD